MKKQLNLMGSLLLGLCAIISAFIAMPKIMESATNLIAATKTQQEAKLAPVALVEPKQIGCERWKIGMVYKVQYMAPSTDPNRSPFEDDNPYFKIRILERKGDWFQTCNVFVSGNPPWDGESRSSFRCGVNEPYVICEIPGI